MSYKISELKIHNKSECVSAVIFLPVKPVAIYVFAHGAGAGMNHLFMSELAHELALLQIATLRFNFYYMEQGKRRPDNAVVAQAMVARAIDTAHELYPLLPLFVGGKSFGGRMTSQLLAENLYPYIKGLIFVGFPLHPIKKPATERALHLKKVTIPLLFLQGTKDALAQIDLITHVCTSLPGATLVKVEGADHSFKIPKQNAIPLLAKSIRTWISKKL
jgi:uncharacterized protein